MNENVKGTLKGLVVNTNKSAGFFYKEMCAYMTGYAMDDGNGDSWECSELYLEKYPLIDSVMEIEIDGEHDIYTGTRLYVTEEKYETTRKNVGATAFIIYLNAIPTEEELLRMKNRAEEFANDDDDDIRIEEMYLLFEEVKETKVTI